MHCDQQSSVYPTSMEKNAMSTNDASNFSASRNAGYEAIGLHIRKEFMKRLIACVITMKEHMERICAYSADSEVRRPPRSQRAGCFVGERAERVWRQNIRQPIWRQSMWKPW